MRVLFVSPGVRYAKAYPFESRGSESQILGISKELAKAGHDVSITGNFEGVYPDFADGTGRVRFIDVPVAAFRDNGLAELGTVLLYSLRVCDAITRVSPDVVCLNDRFSGYFPSKLDFPKAFTTHNPEAMDFNRELSIRHNRLNVLFFGIKKEIEEAVISRCDLIIALTNSIDTYLRGKGFTRTRVIPNGVDESDYRNAGDGGFVLYAGRLAKVKGLPTLLDAFSRLEGHQSVRLVLVGSGPEEPMLRELAKSRGIAGRVQFVPMLAKRELRAYLSECSIFVLPSLFESLPVVVLEAMASGKPVVASNVPGPRDIIKHGVTGFLFERGNAIELKKYIELCLRNAKLRADVGVRARQAVEADYTFGRVARLYCEALSGILGDTP